MIELVFIACLKTDPAACEERTLSYVEEQMGTSCLMRAQPELAAWVGTHPNFMIANWKCQQSRPDKIEI